MIKLEGMSLKERNKVREEVEFMKSVKALTVIQFFDSVVDNDVRYIYMEYAYAGALNEKISEIQLKGLDFTYEEIIDWLCQIMISLFILHKSKMIHIDIKTKNILLKLKSLIMEKYIYMQNYLI